MKTQMKNLYILYTEDENNAVKKLSATLKMRKSPWNRRIPAVIIGGHFRAVYFPPLSIFME